MPYLQRKHKFERQIIDRHSKKCVFLSLQSVLLETIDYIDGSLGFPITNQGTQITKKYILDFILR